MEHDIPFGNSNRENGTTFLDFPLFLGIFQWDEPTKRVPLTAESEIPEILTKWKAPKVSDEIKPHNKKQEIPQQSLRVLTFFYRKPFLLQFCNRLELVLLENKVILQIW